MPSLVADRRVEELEELKGDKAIGDALGGLRELSSEEDDAPVATAERTHHLTASRS